MFSVCYENRGSPKRRFKVNFRALFRNKINALSVFGQELDRRLSRRRPLEPGRSVKTNQDRRGRFAFGIDPKRYDRGRPSFSGRIVQRGLARSGFSPGDRVLEIGAGSGQLTGELLRTGAAVTALEPSDGFAELLQSSHPEGARGVLKVHGVTFERFESSGRFALVTAANAFHWIDPDVSYRKAADLLAPTGRL